MFRWEQFMHGYKRGKSELIQIEGMENGRGFKLQSRPQNFETKALLLYYEKSINVLVQ